MSLYEANLFCCFYFPTRRNFNFLDLKYLPDQLDNKKQLWNYSGDQQKLVLESDRMLGELPDARTDS